MSFSVNTNAGAFRALQNLNATSSVLDRTQSRVNTGLKVASAKDSGSVYSIAQNLRADVAGYNAVKGSLDRAISEVDIALAGAEAISDLLIEMKEKAVAAKDEGLDNTSRISLNDDFQALKDQIDSIANSAEFNGRNLLTGNSVTAITDANGSSSSTISTSVTQLTLTSLGLDTTSISSTSSSSTNNTQVQADTFANYPFQSGDNLAALNNYLETNFNSLYNNGSLYDQSTGNFTNSSGGDSADQVATALASSFSGAVFGTLSSSGNYIYLHSGTVYTSGSGASSEFTLSATSSASGGAAEAVDTIETAIDTVNTVLSNLGSTANRLAIQQTFTSKLADSINIGVGNLVDADLAKESALLQATQTKQQLGLQALSIANQGPQSVLSLFR